MSGKTVTDKRIDAERAKSTEICARFYVSIFPKENAGMEFWREANIMDDKLAVEIKQRPLSSMQVRKAFHAYTVAFKRACNARGS